MDKIMKMLAEDESSEPLGQDDYDEMAVKEMPIAKVTLDGVQRLIVGLVLVLIVALSGLLVTIGGLNTKLHDTGSRIDQVSSTLIEVQNNQTAGAERSYKLIGIACANLVSEAGPLGLPDICFDPAVKQYVDVAAIIAAQGADGGG